MPVELTFNAPTVFELNDQIRAYCGQLYNGGRVPDYVGSDDRPPNYGHGLRVAPGPNDAKYTSPLVETDPVAVAQGVNIGETPKPRRKHRKTKGLEPSETKVPVLSDDTPAEPQPEPQPEPLAEPLPWEVPPPAPETLGKAGESGGTDALANEKLKSEVIATLQDMFAAGKVKTIRGVLDKFGGGAKSFPEVDASRFHEIKSALASGEFA